MAENRFIDQKKITKSGNLTYTLSRYDIQNVSSDSESETDYKILPKKTKLPSEIQQAFCGSQDKFCDTQQTFCDSQETFLDTQQTFCDSQEEIPDTQQSLCDSQEEFPDSHNFHNLTYGNEIDKYVHKGTTNLQTNKIQTK